MGDKDTISKEILTNMARDISKLIYYSAENDYSIDKLLDLLIDNMPKTKREIYL